MTDDAAFLPSRESDQGTPLFTFLVRRIIESWHVPSGVAQYYQWIGSPDDLAHPVRGFFRTAYSPVTPPAA